MTAPNAASPPQQPPEPQPTATEPQATEPQAAPASPQDFVYPNDYAVPFLRGKTAAEAALLLAENPAAAPQAQPEPPAFDPQEWGEPDRWLADRLGTVASQYLQPQLAAQGEMLGRLTRQNAQMLYRDEFQRWGAEIDALVKDIPAEQRTPELYDRVVRMVRGDHAHELAREQAEHLLRQRIAPGDVMRPDARSNGSPVSGSDGFNLDGTLSHDDPRLPPKFRNISRADVVDMVQKFYAREGGATPANLKRYYTAAMQGAASG